MWTLHLTDDVSACTVVLVSSLQPKPFYIRRLQIKEMRRTSEVSAGNLEGSRIFEIPGRRNADNI
jgi:hypothetical protein